MDDSLWHVSDPAPLPSTGIGLHAFARCPLEVLKLSGPGNCRLPERGALHGAIAQARTLSLCCDGYSAKFLESLVHAVVS